MKPLRILHVVANRWWTGSADPALDLARALKARGHAVWFGCVRGDVLETHVRAAGVPLVEGLSLERTARPWRLAAQIGTLRRTLRELEIDVVHAHQTHDHWLAALGAPWHQGATGPHACTIAGPCTPGRPPAGSSGGPMR